MNQNGTTIGRVATTAAVLLRFIVFSSNLKRFPDTIYLIRWNA